MSIVLLSVFVAGCKRSYGPDVVATVNGQPIQGAEVEKAYRDNLGNNKEQPTKEQAEATRLGILRTLIDEEILQQEAKKMNLVAGDEEVDAKLAEIQGALHPGGVRPAAASRQHVTGGSAHPDPAYSHVGQAAEQRSELADQHHRRGRLQFL